MSDQWTVDDVPITWMRDPINGVPAAKRWRSAPRKVERPLLGLRAADSVTIGYLPYEVSGPIYVEPIRDGGGAITTTADDAAATLEALDGLTADVNDGATTYTGVTVEVVLRRVHSELWTGEARLVRVSG